MARLIRTEKEVEGNYTEQWIVVDEDPVAQWPAGPRETVGQPARARRRARAGTRRGRLHGRRPASGDAPHRGPAQPARERARDAARPVARRSRRPACARPSRPKTSTCLTREPAYPGAAVAAVAADTLEQAEAARQPGRRRVGGAQPLLDAEEAVRQGSLIDEPERYERGDVERGFAEADVVVEAEYRTQTVLHNSMETHQSVCQWEGDVLDLYTSTQFIWGVRDETAEKLGIPQDNVRGHLQLHGRRLRREEPPRRVHVHRRRAREAHRPARPLRAHAQGGEPRERQPSRDRPAAARGREGGRNAHRALRRLRHGRRLPRLQELDGGADEDAVRVPECFARSSTARSSTPARTRPSARPDSSRGRSASSACWTSSPPSWRSIRSSCARTQPRRQSTWSRTGRSPPRT